jgi:hypothetical protein
MCARTSLRQNEKTAQREYVFFLERLARHLHTPYLLLYVTITVIIELLRIVVDYVTVTGKLQYSVNDLVVSWRSNWLVFMWPICMFLMYYSMRYLRDYTLHTVKEIRPRLKESPTYTLTKVFCGRIQHLIPLGFLIICTLYFADMWFSNGNFTFSLAARSIAIAPAQEIPLKFLHTAIWITYNWIIGGYFSWTCISTIIVIYAASKRIHNIDVFHHDKSGGLSVVGSLAMRTALLYIFSVSFMFPGWIVTVSSAQDPVSLGLQIGALSCLVIMELAIFLLPMTFFHSRMAEAKNTKLANLEARIANFHDSLTKDRTSDEDNRRFQNIVALRQIVLSMNEYPFNYGMIAKVSFSATTPYIAAIFQVLVEPILHGNS